MTAAGYTLPAMAQHRPWHELDCPARDVAVRRIAATCTCPNDGRWLNPAARPVAEPEGAAARHFRTSRVNDEVRHVDGASTGRESHRVNN